MFSANFTEADSEVLKLFRTTEGINTKVDPDVQLVKAPKKPKSWYGRGTLVSNSEHNNTQYVKSSNHHVKAKNFHNASTILMPTFKQFIHKVLLDILSCNGNHACIMTVEPHYGPASAQCSTCRLQPDFIFKVIWMNINKTIVH